jgi:hypothetical protein
VNTEQCYLVAAGLAAGLAEQARSGRRRRARGKQARAHDRLQPLERLQLLAAAIEWLRIAAANKLELLLG